MTFTTWPQQFGLSQSHFLEQRGLPYQIWKRRGRAFIWAQLLEYLFVKSPLNPVTESLNRGPRYTGWSIWLRLAFCWHCIGIRVTLWYKKFILCGTTVNLMSTNSALRPDGPACTLHSVISQFLLPGARSLEKRKKHAAKVATYCHVYWAEPKEPTQFGSVSGSEIQNLPFSHSGIVSLHQSEPKDPT